MSKMLMEKIMCTKNCKFLTKFISCDLKNIRVRTFYDLHFFYYLVYNLSNKKNTQSSTTTAHALTSTISLNNLK